MSAMSPFMQALVDAAHEEIAKSLLPRGTSGARQSVKRSLRRNALGMAAIQVPGVTEAIGMGAGAMAGPGVGAAAYGAARVAGAVASIALGRRIARRVKIANYLANRAKRTTGVYKANRP